MGKHADIAFAAATAQAAYAFFSSQSTGGDISILGDGKGGEFALPTANRFLGENALSNTPFDNGLVRVAHTPDQANGFSATVFRQKGTGEAILAIRGSNDLADFAQDALLFSQGAAVYQLISLYRYYKCLITPEGQAVTYTEADQKVLHSLNVPLPGSLTRLIFGRFTDAGDNAALDRALATDRGLGVLAPNEQLVVTGHSLGGHLAVLFGRAFPSVTEHVYTFNAPGTPSWGNPLLANAGLSASDPSRVTNVVSDNGLDMTAALGAKPGETIRIHNEATASPFHNHSIARQSESLALYDLFGALSPTLGLKVNDISAILSASSSKPTETLESALDMLGLAFGEEFDTGIAVGTSDSAAREEYFSNLYSLRDQHSGANDWQIISLAGLTASQLVGISSRVGVRFALSELTPFAVLQGEFDQALLDLSPNWVFARAEFLSGMTQARTDDAIFGQSGSLRNYTFIDVDRDERLSLLSAGMIGVALSHGADADIRSFLDGLLYDRVTAFGSDYVETPDSLAGSAGGDRLFGNAGDDTISAMGGDDVIEDGAGADSLVGGAGNDSYFLLNDSSVDRIHDSDGKGSIRVNGGVLTGGFERSEGIYASWDNQHTYAFTGSLLARGTLTIDESIVVEDFLDGDLGIHLVGVPDLMAEATDYVFTGEREILLEDPYDAWENRLASGPLSPGYFDYFRNGRPGDTRFELGAGNDAAKDIHGGDDVLILGAGQDYGAGGVGNDWVEGGDDYDVVDGEDGNDILYAGSPDDDIEGPPPSWTADVPVFLLEMQFGGAGDDTVIGSALRDYIEGGGGSDQILAGAGNDLIAADGRRWEVGDEMLFSSDFMRGASNQPPPGAPSALSLPASVLDSPDAGADTVHAGSGNDTVIAGSGGDQVFGGAGRDSIVGGAGNDELHADLGFDSVYGGDGDDLVIGGADGGLLHGDAGDDTLVSASAANELRGGAGADVYEGSFVGMVGDGDTVRFRFGIGQSATLFADGGAPGTFTIEFGVDVVPSQVYSRGTDGAGSWGFSSYDESGAVNFVGNYSQWTGVTAVFADGTIWSHADIAAQAGFLPPLPPLPPISGGGEGGGEGGGPPAPPGGSAASSDDQYHVSDGGRRTISDYAGNDRVTFTTLVSEDVSVFTSGSDMLLRYDGGEVRLAGQVDSANGIEAVTFAGDGVTWDRATLASHATALPATLTGPLGIEIVAPGQAFSFVVGDAFAGEYAVGDTRLDVSDMQGGALPAWLTFDAAQGAFSGTPTADDAGVTTVLVALRDESGVAAVAPLIIAVEASADPGGSGGGGEEPVPAPIPATVDEVPAARTAPALQDAGFFAPPAVPAPQPNSLAIERVVGEIDDPVYHAIERLLAAPAALHAPSFMERYADAVREFRERHPVREDIPADPLPTDEEMAAHNASLHAWLDADQRRLAVAAHDGAWDLGGMEMNWVHPGGGIDRLLGGGSDGLARPGLPALPVIQQQPGLREGLVTLGG